jgi:hypothetical protein
MRKNLTINILSRHHAKEVGGGSIQDMSTKKRFTLIRRTGRRKIREIECGNKTTFNRCAETR